MEKLLNASRHWGNASRLNPFLHTSDIVETPPRSSGDVVLMYPRIEQLIPRDLTQIPTWEVMPSWM